VCLQDLAIGAATDAGEIRVTVGTGGSDPVIGGNPHRTFLYFTPPTTGALWLSTGFPAVVGLGFHLHSALPGLLMHIKDYGQLVRKGWYGINDTATCQLCVFEGSLDLERMLKFMAEYGAR
jgi:hypothetical protein